MQQLSGKASSETTMYGCAEQQQPGMLGFVPRQALCTLLLCFCMGIEQVMLRESYSTHPGCSCSRQHSPLTADVDQSCSVSLTGALSHPTHPPEAPLPLRASTEYILHYISRYLCVIDVVLQHYNAYASMFHTWLSTWLTVSHMLLHGHSAVCIVV